MNIKPDSLTFTGMLAGISALPPLSIDMNLPAIPEIESALSVAPGQGALTFSLFLLGFAIAPLIGGPLSDRFGRKTTLLISLLITSLAAFACTFTISFNTLLVCRMLQGTAAGVCILAPLAIVRDTLTGPDARRQLSRIMFVVGIAPLLAPILGAWVLEASGWRSIYGVQGCFGLFLLIFVAIGFAETLPFDRRTPLNPGQLATGYKTVFTNKTFLGFALLMSFNFGCMFSYISGSPGLLLGKLKLTEQTYSLIFALTAFGLMSGSFLSGRLGRREIRSRSIISFTLPVLVAGVGAALTLALSNAVQPITIVPILFTTMVCFGLIQPNAMAEAVDQLGHIAGTASGALNALQMLVGAIASASVTFLTGFLDPGVAMTVAMAGSILLAAGIYYGTSPGKVKIGDR